jgi:hypothetical protein
MTRVTDWSQKGKRLAADFGRDGFAVAEGLADADCLATLRPIYDGFIDGSIECPTSDRKLGGLTRQIITPHLYSPELRRNPAVEHAREIARAIQGVDKPEFVFSMMIYKPGGHPHDTPWHQDMSYAGVPTLPTGTIVPNNIVVTFWLAIDDVTEDMGCMEFIPGVQEGPMPEHVVYAGEPDASDRLLAIRDPDHRLPVERAVKCPLKAGSATIHGYGTPHFTAPNRTDRGRKAFIFSFNHPDTTAIIGRILAAAA